MSKEVKITDVDLFVTEKCNLKCRYCFHPKSDGELTSENAKLIIDKLAVLCAEKLKLNFWGGEPLLNRDVIRNVIEYSRGLWAPGNVEYHVVTNGTIYDRDFFKFLFENGAKIQVSLDGEPESNDQDRAQGALVAENIKKLLMNFPDLSVRMTYTPKNVHNLVKNICYIRDLGVRSIMHQAVIEEDWSESSYKAFYDQTETLYKIRIKNPEFGVMFMDKNLMICDDMQKVGVEFCGAGRQLIAILPNGDVYPCHRAASNRVFKLGNILTGRIIRGMFLNTDKATSGCIGCESWKTCHTCMVSQYQKNGRIDKPIESYCKLMYIESSLAKKYVPILKQEDMLRTVKAIAKVTLDLSEQVNEMKETMEGLKKRFEEMEVFNGQGQS